MYQFLEGYGVLILAVFFGAMLAWAAWDSAKEPPEKKPEYEVPPRKRY